MIYHGWFHADGSARIRYYAEPSHDTEGYQISIPIKIPSGMPALIFTDLSKPWVYARFNIPDTVTTLEEAKAWAIAMWRMM